MFSRSEKTEESADLMADSSEQRNPMVLAALAGLLAIAGAFLLVWYLSNGDGDGQVAAEPGSTEAGAAVTADNSKQVLVVTQTIPRGTSVRELIAAPTVYLSARAVPEQFVAASAITSIAELQDLDGLVLASDALPDEQLLRGRFRDPNDTDSNDETFLEANSDIETPPGHHSVVFDIAAVRALGGLVQTGEEVTILGNFRVSPEGRSTRDMSVVVLNQVLVLNKATLATGVSQEIDQIGQGTIQLTVAVRPTEITDLMYAIEYGNIYLATALDELSEEEAELFPRAVTTMRQIVGDDGIWIGELEDGDVVDLVELFPPVGLEEEGISIEVELPEGVTPSGEDPSQDQAVEEAPGDS